MIAQGEGLMSKNTYKLTFLPLFKEDLLETLDYITNTLQNPKTAHRLVDDIESAIDKRLESPLLLAPYQSSTTREHPYYRISVRNFSVFLRCHRRHYGSAQTSIFKTKY